MHHDVKRPALYVRCSDAEGVAAAARLGADGVSLDLRLDEGGAVTAGRDPLEALTGLAEELGLAVDLVAGHPLDPRPATPLVAAVVATMVSSRRIRDAVRLSSFDHVAVSTIGRSAGELSIGLRHLVTLHRGEEYASGLGAATLHPLAGEVSRDDVARARARGIATHAWTLAVDFWPVDEATQLAHAIASGADAVTLTDSTLLTRAKDPR